MDSSAPRGGLVTSAMDFINCIVWASAAELDCMTASLRTASTKLILLILYLQVTPLIHREICFLVNCTKLKVSHHLFL